MTAATDPIEPTEAAEPQVGASVVTDVRARLEALAREVWDWSTNQVDDVRAGAGDTAKRSREQLDALGSRVRDELDRALQEMRTRTAQVRDEGRERLGDARGRVQPVVEQVQSRAQRVVDAGRDRAKTIVGRTDQAA